MKASHGRSPPRTAIGWTRAGNPRVTVARLVASACVGVGMVIEPPKRWMNSLDIDCTCTEWLPTRSGTSTSPARSAARITGSARPSVARKTVRPVDGQVSQSMPSFS